MFRDLQYSVGKSPDRAARILKGVSGHVFPGQMCALMGGSGAGKSTLLDLLAYRKTGGFITGEYYIGGQAEKPSSKWCSYVTQDNVHISLFTVRETLEFAALLRLKEGLPVEKRRERAEDVMKMLGLEDVADVPVGNALAKGISGGQARRLSIGVEIMHLPDGRSISDILNASLVSFCFWWSNSYISRWTHNGFGFANFTWGKSFHLTSRPLFHRLCFFWTFFLGVVYLSVDLCVSIFLDSTSIHKSILKHSVILA